MPNIVEFEAELDTAIVDLESLAAKAPEPFKTQMQGPLAALTAISKEIVDQDFRSQEMSNERQSR